MVYRQPFNLLYFLNDFGTNRAFNYHIIVVFLDTFLAYSVTTMDEDSWCTGVQVVLFTADKTSFEVDEVLTEGFDCFFKVVVLLLGLFFF